MAKTAAWRSITIPPNALCVVAIGRKNYLFAGSNAGGRRAAALYSLIESAKLNRLNPQHYPADVLAGIADHSARRLPELLPWNWQPIDATRAAALAGPLTKRLLYDCEPRLSGSSVSLIVAMVTAPGIPSATIPAVA